MGKGCFCKIVDCVLFAYFAIIVIVAPVMDAPTCLPSHLVPSFSVETTAWYARTFDDYLIGSEKAQHFFVGIMYVDLFFQWPLAVVAVYAIATTKPWFSTISLIYGVSAFSSSAALISEITLSKRASVKLLMMYYPYLGYGLLALFRGLFGMCVGKGEERLQRKKRA